MAILWDDQSGETCDRAERVMATAGATFGARARSVCCRGMAVFNLTKEPEYSVAIPVQHCSGQIAGTIIGTLFARSPANGTHPQIKVLGSQDAERMLESAGASCLTDFWGNYICFLRTNKTIIVATSPTSTIPCFVIEQDGLTFVFSHLEKCVGIDLARLTIDEEFISALLVYDKIQNGQTGFHEIREVMGGQRVTVSDDPLAIETIWDPRVVALNTFHLNIEEAGEEIAAVTQRIVRSWSCCFERVAVNLSGGLDSSIVLGCLEDRMQTQSIRAFHHKLISEDQQEVRYARMAAAHLNCPLTEIPIRSDLSLPDIETHPLTARPFRQFLDPDLDMLFSGWLGGGPDVFLTGQGGDHLFHVRPTHSGLADYLHDCGPGPDLARQLLDSARLSGLSIWQVLARTVRVRRRTANAMISAISKRTETTISKGALPDNLSDLLPEWARHSAGLPPGKFDQTVQLAHLLQEREVLDRPVSRRFVHPLVSQPLIELCLRIPVYVLCAGGVSRGLVRRAFQGHVPDSIRLRMTKGESTRFFIDHMTANKDCIIAALSSGELSRMGFIDGQDIETIFSRGNHETIRYGHSILIMYAIEAWLRKWRKSFSSQAPKTSLAP